nr:hypothetical protein [Solirubrobacterales bacterium]
PLLGVGLVGALFVLLPRWRGRGRTAVLAAPLPAVSAADAARLDEDLRRFDR